LFTPVIKALQERHGSRRQYEKRSKAGGTPERLGRREAEFIAERDSFYLASVGETGWPYIQHRGGPKGRAEILEGEGPREWIERVRDPVYEAAIERVLRDPGRGVRL
jgi:hypothetical protein